MKSSNGIVDWEQYGVLLRASRLKNGYSRGSSLAKAVLDATGMRIAERTIYALESAERTPSADIFFAIQQVLPELRDPEYLKPCIKNSNITVAVVKL